MNTIGRVVHVQVQQAGLKRGERPVRIYNPEPLVIVDELHLLPQGVMGHTADGGQIIDVHHTDHPDTRNINVNPISIGFTHHYDLMRQEFGSHLFNGCAGENILVESQHAITLDIIENNLAFLNPDSGQLIRLKGVMVAAPCVEFSHYVHQANLETAQLPAETTKATLQFLDDGLRGFYAQIDPASTQAILRAGDLLVVLE